MKLKQYTRQLTFLLTAALIYSLTGCDKKDSNTPFGLTNIYIPQSTVSGGVNLNYMVPSGMDSATYNYKIDKANNKVNVYLGVTRSGKEAYDAYSVTVSTRADTIAQLIANNTISSTKPVVLLPSAAYTLPATVSVPQGQYMTNFNLVIDETQLKTFAGKIVALCITISNPNKYTLSPINNKVIVIINVDALKLI
ncbi:MAG: hypothetical protein JWR67_1449 [Mucilaginibacter sp.]|nr:hypothetical protein [Mucilaginibacter sp.]